MRTVRMAGYITGYGLLNADAGLAKSLTGLVELDVEEFSRGGVTVRVITSRCLVWSHRRFCPRHGRTTALFSPRLRRRSRCRARSVAVRVWKQNGDVDDVPRRRTGASRRAAVDRRRRRRGGQPPVGEIASAQEGILHSWSGGVVDSDHAC